MLRKLKTATPVYRSSSIPGKLPGWTLHQNDIVVDLGLSHRKDVSRVLSKHGVGYIFLLEDKTKWDVPLDR